ncbi:MAG: single-stranded DNA-binding protein [Flavobacteriales bacterium]|nr:single-stranded DNA-binding protein [Flavobacteriales bacterium]
MSTSLNKVMLIGRLGKDVQIHKFEDGNSIANFPLATSESYLEKKDGKKVEKTEWHKIVVKNKLAEICEKYLNKGNLIYVEGKLHTNKWEDKGISKYSTEIIASKIEFLNTKNSESTPEWLINEEDLPY